MATMRTTATMENDDDDDDDNNNVSSKLKLQMEEAMTTAEQNSVFRSWCSSKSLWPVRAERMWREKWMVLLSGEE